MTEETPTVCNICVRPSERFIDPESVPDELIDTAVEMVEMEVAEALGRAIPIVNRDGSFRDQGNFAEHIPCDVVTKARELVAQHLGFRMKVVA